MTDDQRQWIKDKVAASQERLRRESDGFGALPSPARFPDAYPPEDYRSLLREHPLLAIAAGAGLGLLAGALLPRGLGGKAGRRAVAAAAVVGDLALTLSQQARDKAADAGREGLSLAEEGTRQLRGRAQRLAGTTRSGARSAGLLIAREAIRLAARARR